MNFSIIKTGRKWATLFILGTVLSSCMKEDWGLRETGDDESVVIKFGFGGTRAPEVGDQADYNIGSARVLIYERVDGKLAFNIPFSTVPVPGSPARIDIRTGTYDFVFIANEASDLVFQGKLNTPAAIDNISKLRAISLAGSSFATDKDIPMVTLIEQVEVSGDETIQTPAMSAPQAGVWTVGLEKTAIRLKLSITMSPFQFSQWESPHVISIAGIADGAYVLPGIDNSAMQNAAALTFAAGTPDEARPGIISEATEGMVTVSYDRLILPELFLSPANNKADNAMTLSMDFGDKVKTGMIKAPDGDAVGYALPRNTYLAMAATVQEDSVDVSAIVLPWNEPDVDVIFDGQYSLLVDKDEIVLRGSARLPGEVTARTNYDISDQGFPPGLQVDNADTEYISGGTGWLYDIIWKAGGDGVLEGTIELKAKSPNTTTATRTAKVSIKAGNMTKIINVSQTPMGILASPGVLGYTEDTHELTLRGSREYAANPDIKAAALDMFPDEGGLHEQTVYVAYYKWNSLVAVGSENRTGFSADDIVWAPDEYTFNGLSGTQAMKASIGTNTNAAGWALIPAKAVSTDGYTYDSANGYGDPCLAITEAGGGWTTPIGGPAGIGWNNGSFGSTNSTMIPYPTGSGWVNKDTELPENGAVGQIEEMPDWSMFLPAIGIRRYDGGGNGVTTYGTDGHYWAQTPAPDPNSAWKLQISQGNVVPSGQSAVESFGMGVRCVGHAQPPKVYEDLTQAPPGVVGIKHSDLLAIRTGEKTPASGFNLTVAGSGGYYSTLPATANTAEFGAPETEPVYVVHFKWGSMIATIGAAGDTWSSDDVVWVNPEFIGSITDSYESFAPASTTGTLGTGNNILPASESGHGDICAAIPGGTWHMPTESEMEAFMAGATVLNVPPAWLTKGGIALLPTAGLRGTDTPNYTVGSIGVAGVYWTSTAPLTDMGYQLLFRNNGSVEMREDQSAAFACSVRCVPTVSVYKDLIQASPGGVWESN